MQGVRNDMVINDGSVCFMMGQCNAMMILPIEMFFFHKRGSKGQIKVGDITENNNQKLIYIDNGRVLKSWQSSL